VPENSGSAQEAAAVEPQAIAQHIAQLLEHLSRIAQLPPPESEADIHAFMRSIGSASLEAVSIYFYRSKLAPDYISLPLQRLAIALLDLNKKIPNPIFEKPPNTKKSPDPLMIWLFRAEAAALLKVLVEQNYGSEKALALQIFKSLERWIPKVTSRALANRESKDKKAKKPIPSKLITNWLAKFEETDVALKAQAEMATTGTPAVVDKVAAEFGDARLPAIERFRSHCRGLLSEWQKIPERERAAWVEGRIQKLQQKLRAFRP
jgi:hypothetical protein